MSQYVSCHELIGPRRFDPGKCERKRQGPGKGAEGTYADVTVGCIWETIVGTGDMCLVVRLDHYRFPLPQLRRRETVEESLLRKRRVSISFAFTDFDGW